eukprot:scaffold2576_cov136-Isochrysis_galbana.AAC.5
MGRPIAPLAIEPSGPVKGREERTGRSMSGLCSFFHWKIFAKKIYLPSTFPPTTGATTAETPRTPTTTAPIRKTPTWSAPTQRTLPRPPLWLRPAEGGTAPRPTKLERLPTVALLRPTGMTFARTLLAFFDGEALLGPAGLLPTDILTLYGSWLAGARANHRLLRYSSASSWRSRRFANSSAKSGCHTVCHDTKSTYSSSASPVRRDLSRGGAAGRKPWPEARAQPQLAY